MPYTFALTINIPVISSRAIAEEINNASHLTHPPHTDIRNNKGHPIALIPQISKIAALTFGYLLLFRLVYKYRWSYFGDTPLFLAIAPAASLKSALMALTFLALPLCAVLITPPDPRPRPLLLIASLKAVAGGGRGTPLIVK